MISFPDNSFNELDANFDHSKYNVEQEQEDQNTKNEEKEESGLIHAVTNFQLALYDCTYLQTILKSAVVTLKQCLLFSSGRCAHPCLCRPVLRRVLPEGATATPGPGRPAAQAEREAAAAAHLPGRGAGGQAAVRGQTLLRARQPSHRASGQSSHFYVRIFIFYCVLISKRLLHS